MSLFAKRKSPLERAIAQDWTGEGDKAQVLAQVRAQKMTAPEAAKLLDHADASFRQVGARSWAGAASSADVMALANDMRTKPPHVKTFMGRIISHVSPAVLEESITQLLDVSKDVTGKTGWELASFIGGHLRTRYLERAVIDGPLGIRTSALQRLLMERQPTEMVDLLVELARDKDQRMAGMALDAACRVHDPRMVALMVDRMGKGDNVSRGKAEAYVRQLKEQDPIGLRKGLKELLAEGEESNRHLTIRLMLETGEAEQVLLEILEYCRDLLGWLRSRILQSLRQFGQPIPTATIALLRSPDVNIRTVGLGLAEDFSDGRLTEPLIEMLDDPDWWIRLTACQFLGSRKDKAAVPRLTRALDDEDSRWAAITALGRIGAQESIEPLVRLLRDTRNEIRLEVIQALAQYTDERLVPLLQAVSTRDKSSEIRTRAGELLQELAARLDQQIETNDQQTVAVDADSLETVLDRLLTKLRVRGASDLHLAPDEPPFMRMHGALIRIEGMDPTTTEQIKETVMPSLSDKQFKVLDRTGQLDFCHAIREVGRYRGNICRERKGIAAAYRVVPNTPPTFRQLRLPPQLLEIKDYHQGIIIVSGATGSGKSTSLASFVNLVNETKPCHIITLEDPIEFVHPAKTALVNQREVGEHTESYARALRAALREDPDVILVGELRDLETIRLALIAAETGHLVMSTLHTPNCVETINRLVAVFPPEEQAQVRTSLSEALKFVMCQSLAPRKDGMGRAGVFEVMKCLPSVANLIREGKTHQIPNIMQVGRSVGMQTVDQALMELVDAELIVPEEAWRRAQTQSLFAPMCSHEFLKSMGVIH